MPGVSVRNNQKHNKRIKILIKIKLNARPHAWLLIWRKALSTECGLAAGVCMTPWAMAGPAQWGLCSDPGLSALWESRSPSQFICTFKNSNDHKSAESSLLMSVLENIFHSCPGNVKYFVSPFCPESAVAWRPARYCSASVDTQLGILTQETGNNLLNKGVSVIFDKLCWIYFIFFHHW